MNKAVRVILLDEAEILYKKFIDIAAQQTIQNKEGTFEIQLLRSIKQKIDFIKANPFYGDHIKKNLIPREYAIKYDTKNLWRAELVNYWRLLYTIKGNQNETTCFVIGIMNHEEK